MKWHWDETRMLREAKEGRKGFHFLLELLIFVPVFLVAGILEAIPSAIAEIGWIFAHPAVIREAAERLQSGDTAGYFASIQALTNEQPIWMTIVSLLATGLAILAVWLYCRLIERRRITSMGFRKGHILREYLVGIGITFVMISFAALIGLLTGAYRFSLSPGISVGLLLLFCIGYMVQGASEEVICRGYLMVSITRRNKAWIAVLVSSLVFAALHLANPGFNFLAFVNIALCGASYGIYILKRGNIWGACALHSFWNFFQGNFWGISVSGTGWGMNASVFTATAVPGKELWNGGAFGIEGGLAATAAEVLCLLFVIFLLPANREEYTELPHPGV
ncbi:MAG: CPBP family intramembrane metalloprotease [Clostridia bacterium]|nr:CPBP family intramembrane metalloprotease [Clostridia bacterium]